MVLTSSATGPDRTAHRNVRVLALSIFGLALGEELWQAYLPAYLAALGASGVVVGLFGSAKDLLDSAYQYPGGRLADRAGPRLALRLFTAVAIVGYAIYAAAPGWPLMFAGLAGVMAWKAGAFPATFAVIGESLPQERRATAFSVQSILVRVPRVIGAPLGGIAIASLGTVAGIRICFAVTIVLALAVLAAQHWGMADGAGDRRAPNPATVRGSTRSIPRALRRLLVADCLVRIGEGIAASFIVLFVLQVRGFSAAEFGLLYAVQQAVAIASYLPGGRIADRAGRDPIVAVTFVFFALFPLAVRLATGYPALLAAFVVGGLKEIGEPARKSLIVDLAPGDRRASTVGLYYGIRNCLVVPAGVIGGVLWQRSPELPLEAAFAMSSVGLALFLLTSGAVRVKPA
jgi:predicted MFS family arabinose efflux permease